MSDIHYTNLRTFTTLSWLMVGLYGPGFSRIPSILISLIIIYELATEAEAVTDLQDDVFECFSRLEQYIQDKLMMIKVTMFYSNAT